MKTGIHALRLILAGIFDHYPCLQIILGHWGEMILFFLARINEAVVAKHLKRGVSYYFLHNFHVTPSGMFTLPPFLNTIQMIGADRIMYAVDYPYIISYQARTFLENAHISPADKEKIAYGNAEKVLKI
jgi:predicted TIM-barrel fold metal-dependent hydrolase